MKYRNLSPLARVLVDHTNLAWVKALALAVEDGLISLEIAAIITEEAGARMKHFPRIEGTDK